MVVTSDKRSPYERLFAIQEDALPSLKFVEANVRSVGLKINLFRIGLTMY